MPMPMAWLAMPDLVEEGISKAPLVARQALEGMASRKRAPQRIGLTGGQEVDDRLRFGSGSNSRVSARADWVRSPEHCVQRPCFAWLAKVEGAGLNCGHGRIDDSVSR